MNSLSFSGISRGKGDYLSISAHLALNHWWFLKLVLIYVQNSICFSGEGLWRHVRHGEDSELEEPSWEIRSCACCRIRLGSCISAREERRSWSRRRCWPCPPPALTATQFLPGQQIPAPSGLWMQSLQSQKRRRSEQPIEGFSAMMVSRGQSPRGVDLYTTHARRSTRHSAQGTFQFNARASKLGKFTNLVFNKDQGILEARAEACEWRGIGCRGGRACRMGRGAGSHMIWALVQCCVPRFCWMTVLPPPTLNCTGLHLSIPMRRRS